MGTIPTGTVTFLFTDIEGSTKLAQEYPDKLPVLLARHNEILDQAIKACDGFLFRTIGDAYCVAFQNASDALHAALQAQRNLYPSAIRIEKRFFFLEPLFFEVSNNPCHSADDIIFVS